MIDYIRSVAIYVEDQNKALDFYTRKLGFQVRRKESLGPRGQWIEVVPPGAQTALVTATPGALVDTDESAGAVATADARSAPRVRPPATASGGP